VAELGVEAKGEEEAEAQMHLKMPWLLQMAARHIQLPLLLMPLLLRFKAEHSSANV